jgi:Protein of unknown function (DUF3102)
MSISNVVSTGPVERIVLSAQFDYSDLSASVTQFLRGQAERIRQRAASSVISIGNDLIGVKDYLSHGAFIVWVETEVGIPARTAQAYMRVAKWASHKNATVAHLPPSLLYLLSASSTPDAFTVDVLKRAEAGERLLLSVIRNELRALRESMQDPSAGTIRGEPERSVRFTLSSAPPEIKSDIAANPSNTSVLEAITILARELSERDFARVREIMTNRSVLNDPELPQKIFSAFEAERPRRTLSS